MTWTWIVSSSEIVFVSYFSIAGVEANSLPIIRLTPRSNIYFVIVKALIDFFKTFITWEYFFFSALFFAGSVFALSITVSGMAKDSIIGTKSVIKLLLRDSHSLNQTFLDIVYSLFF